MCPVCEGSGALKAPLGLRFQYERCERCAGSGSLPMCDHCSEEQKQGHNCGPLQRLELERRRAVAKDLASAAASAAADVDKLTRRHFWRYFMQLKDEGSPNHAAVEVRMDLTGAHESIHIPVRCIDEFCQYLQELKALAPKQTQ